MSNTDDTKAMIAVMQAYVDGAEIEVVRLGEGALGKASIFSWDWDKNDYRVKPDRLTELLTEAHERVMTPKSKWIADAREAHRVHNMLVRVITFKAVEQRATELFGPCPEDVVRGCETCATSYTNNGSGEVCHKAQCWEHAGFPEWTQKQPEKSCETCKHELDDDAGTPCGACGERASFAGWEPKT